MFNSRISTLALGLALFSVIQASGAQAASNHSLTPSQVKDLRDTAEDALSEKAVSSSEGILNSTNPVLAAFRTTACMNVGESIAYLHVLITIDPSSDAEVAPVRDRLNRLSAICSSPSRQ